MSTSSSSKQAAEEEGEVGSTDLLRDAERGGGDVGDVPVEEGEGVGGLRDGGQERDGEERR